MTTLRARLAFYLSVKYIPPMTAKPSKTSVLLGLIGCPKAGPRPSRPHDSAATTAHITDAAATLIAEKGFPGFGVNALATTAGVDKQLIYYHFGGIAGVLRALGKRLDLWLGTPLVPRKGEPYADATRRLMREYTAALRNNPLVQRFLAWELVEPSEVLSDLEATRSAAMGDWVAELRAASGPAPQGVDAPAVNAVLLAGLHYLILREHSVGTFAGMDVKSPEGIERINAAIELIIGRVYDSPALPAKGERATPSKP